MEAEKEHQIQLVFEKLRKLDGLMTAHRLSTMQDIKTCNPKKEYPKQWSWAPTARDKSAE